jgi:hypothetical protein
VIGPTSEQLADMAEGGSMAFAMMPARGEITQLSHVGEWDTEDYQVTWCLSHALCRALFAHSPSHIPPQASRRPDLKPLPHAVTQ